MEFLQIFKALNDQGNQADIQAQLDLLKSSIADLLWSDVQIYFTLGICILLFSTIGAIKIYNLDKKLKVAEKSIRTLEHLNPEYRRELDEAAKSKAHKEFTQKVLLNKVSCVGETEP